MSACFLYRNMLATSQACGMNGVDASWNCVLCNESMPSPPPAFPPHPPPERFVLIENPAITTLFLKDLFLNVPNCMCSYFDPANGGNVFPIVKREAIAAESGSGFLSSGDETVALGVSLIG